jgi:hypothetical protein
VKCHRRRSVQDRHRPVGRAYGEVFAVSACHTTIKAGGQAMELVSACSGGGPPARKQPTSIRLMGHERGDARTRTSLASFPH